MRTVALLLILLGLSSAAVGYEVNIRVVDETGDPVGGAEAVISFVGPLQRDTVAHKGRTTSEGLFRADGETFLQLYVGVREVDHYEARLYLPPPKNDFDKTIVLPRVLDPVSLYAWNTRMGTGLRSAHFPLQGQWLGFDFEAADWVAPHGGGEVADILFLFRNQFMGYQGNVRNLEEEIAFSKRAFAARGEEWSEEKFKLRTGKWDAQLEIAFPGDKEGIYQEPRFWPYSRMKMPHVAPLEGYQPTWRYTANTYSPSTAREDTGFFLRTRVKLGDAGNIVSANYAKVVGDFHLDARGWVMFCYYFNPRPNDQNLEFDVNGNLFPEGFPGSKVNYP